jgi:hypothetical protein
MAGLQQATNGERKKKEEGYFGLFHMFYCSSMAYTELNLKYEGLYRINCFCVGIFRIKSFYNETHKIISYCISFLLKHRVTNHHFKACFRLSPKSV